MALVLFAAALKGRTAGAGLNQSARTALEAELAALLVEPRLKKAG